MRSERHSWRPSAVDYVHGRRLELTACPVSFEVVLATASVRNEEFRKWVVDNLRSGVMLRTSQAEHIAYGRSVSDTARITGVSTRYVLYTLTRLEQEQPAVAAFYGGNGA